jgi:TonB family protein
MKYRTLGWLQKLIPLLSFFVIGCSQSKQLPALVNKNYAVDTMSYNSSYEENILDSLFTDEKSDFTVKTVPPVYPENARRTGKMGLVVMKALVDSTGRVIKAVVLQSDDEIFNLSALSSLMQWEFNPAIFQGRRAGWIKIPMRFTLRY